MSVECKRGCGYRKIGGTYLVSGPGGYKCDRLPIPLGICPCCGNGIKLSRSWTYVDVAKLVEGYHKGCQEPGNQNCILCDTPESIGKAGLLWIGKNFYPTPEHFMAEGLALGFSKRIKFIPRGFKVGETYVLLAHPEAIWKFVKVAPDPKQPDLVPVEEVKYFPGIFTLWRPTRIEKILPDTEKDNQELLSELEKRNISPVWVPANDPDHQGSVFDSKKKVKEDYTGFAQGDPIEKL
jgi:hypothetical protein